VQPTWSLLLVEQFLTVSLMSTDPQFCVTPLDAQKASEELSLGTRIDRNGKTTYHVVSSDRKCGVFLEKVYDQEHRLVRLQKRGSGSRCETQFNPESGAVVRIYESANLPDGNSLTKEIVYDKDDRANEAVVVLSPNGEIVRRVERQHYGVRTVYQGQTEYHQDGTPATTVNHHMDHSSGRLVRREQVQWLREGQRLLSENFYFDQSGALQKYSKVLFHATAGPFIEETQMFDGQTQTILKREIAAFDVNGKQTCMDVLTYDDSGDVLERNSRFFDKDGKEIASLNSSQ
ncbi:MAG: hypothetical protein ACRD3W_10820, partial [Terriglobales bacterium]